MCCDEVDMINLSDRSQINFCTPCLLCPHFICKYYPVGWLVSVKCAWWCTVVGLTCLQAWSLQMPYLKRVLLKTRCLAHSLTFEYNVHCIFSCHISMYTYIALVLLEFLDRRPYVSYLNYSMAPSLNNVFIKSPIN